MVLVVVLSTPGRQPRLHVNARRASHVNRVDGRRSLPFYTRESLPRLVFQDGYGNYLFCDPYNVSSYDS